MSDLERDAARALKLSREGLKGKAIGEALKVSTDRANTLVNLGHVYDTQRQAALTSPEILLLRAVAACARRNASEGGTRSPTSREVAARARKSSGWPAATAGRRLTDRQEWDAHAKLFRPLGLGFVNLSGNGYLTLTSLGWTVVLAMESAGGVHG